MSKSAHKEENDYEIESAISDYYYILLSYTFYLWQFMFQSLSQDFLVRKNNSQIIFLWTYKGHWIFRQQVLRFYLIVR